MIREPPELQAYAALRVLLRPAVPPAERERVAAQVERLNDPQRAWLLRRAVQESGAVWLLEQRRQGLLRLDGPELARLQAAAANELRRTMEADALRHQLKPMLTGRLPQLLMLKGAATEERAYPPGVPRPCVDVDAAVVPGQLSTAQAFLADLGLVCVRRDPSGRTHQYAHPSGGATLDLHLRLGCPKRFPRFGTAEQLEKAMDRSVQLADGTRVLSVPDATLHLLQHLAAGLGGDLRHLADAAQWLQVFPPDPQKLVESADEFGLTRALAAALGWLADLAPAITQQVLDALGPRPLVERVLDNLQHQRVLAHYLRHGPALDQPLSALTELLTVDFPRGALGLTAVTVSSRLRANRLLQ